MNTLLSDQNYTENQALNFASGLKTEKLVLKNGGNVELFDNEEIIVWNKVKENDYNPSIRMGNFSRDLNSDAEYPALLFYNTNEKFPVLDIGVVPSTLGDQEAVISFKKSESGKNVEYASIKLNDSGNIIEKSKGNQTEFVADNSDSSIVISQDAYFEKGSNKSAVDKFWSNIFKWIQSQFGSNSEPDIFEKEIQKISINSNGQVSEIENESTKTLENGSMTDKKSFTIEQDSNIVGIFTAIIRLKKLIENGSLSNNQTEIESINEVFKVNSDGLKSFEKESTLNFGQCKITKKQNKTISQDSNSNVLLTQTSEKITNKNFNIESLVEYFTLDPTSVELIELESTKTRNNRIFNYIYDTSTKLFTKTISLISNPEKIVSVKKIHENGLKESMNCNTWYSLENFDTKNDKYIDITLGSKNISIPSFTSKLTFFIPNDNIHLFVGKSTDFNLFLEQSGFEQPNIQVILKSQDKVYQEAYIRNDKIMHIARIWVNSIENIYLQLF